MLLLTRKLERGSISLSLPPIHPPSASVFCMALMSKMGSGRVLGGGQDVAALLQVEGISHDAVEALLSSASASAGFHGSRSMMCFEDFSPGASAVRQFAHQLEMEDMGEDEADEYGLHQPEKKRRLSAEQVQFLEKSFETENRLEPERKLQLARELGLQPRQVAIWFQNRRARWKTKQLEKDYEMLQSSFKTLKTDFDDLVKEKEKLQLEIQALTEKLLLQEKANSNAGPAEVPSLASSPPRMPLPPRSKLDDMCSASSAVVDHNSRYTEEAWHSSADMPELDLSEISQPEESEGKRKLESASYEFKDDNPWFWSY